MRVRVEFIAPAGLVEGRQDIELELPAGSSVRDLVAALVHRHGPQAGGLILQPDGQTPYVDFIVGGRVVPYDHALRDGDEVAVLPPIHGG